MAAVTEIIQKVLDEEVRPLLANHGGDVILKSFEDGTAVVLFSGACSGCPGAQETFTGIVETKLLEKVPEVKRVEMASVITDDMIDFAKQFLSRGGRNEDRS